MPLEYYNLLIGAPQVNTQHIFGEGSIFMPPSFLVDYNKS